MSQESKPVSWWHTLPGMITAIATLLTAITGLLVGLGQLGFFKSDDSGDVSLAQAEESNSDSRISSKAAAAVKGTGLVIGDVRTRTTPIHGIDQPLNASLGTTYKITLDANEESYFRFRAPGDVQAIVDMQLDGGVHSNLQSRVFLLDQDLAPVGEPVVYLNEIGNSHRSVALLRLPAGATAGLRLLNNNKLADFWVTLLPASSNKFVPFVGQVVPRALKLAENATGPLARHESAYFALGLGAGKYKVLLDFTNAERKNTNLQGYVALLDADGGNERTVFRLNEIDVSYRKTEVFTLTRPQTIIVRLYNESYPVTYAVRITPA